MASILPSQEEKQLDSNVASLGSDMGGQPAVIDKAVERRLVWKTDLILMPALGEHFFG